MDTEKMEIDEIDFILEGIIYPSEYVITVNCYKLIKLYGNKI